MTEVGTYATLKEMGTDVSPEVSVVSPPIFVSSSREIKPSQLIEEPGEVALNEVEEALGYASKYFVGAKRRAEEIEKQPYDYLSTEPPLPIQVFEQASTKHSQTRYPFFDPRETGSRRLSLEEAQQSMSQAKGATHRAVSRKRVQSPEGYKRVVGELGEEIDNLYRPGSYFPSITLEEESTGDSLEDYKTKVVSDYELLMQHLAKVSSAQEKLEEIGQQLNQTFRKADVNLENFELYLDLKDQLSRPADRLLRIVEIHNLDWLEWWDQDLVKRAIKIGETILDRDISQGGLDANDRVRLNDALIERFVTREIEDYEERCGEPPPGYLVESWQSTCEIDLSEKFDEIYAATKMFTRSGPLANFYHEVEEMAVKFGFITTDDKKGIEFPSQADFKQKAVEVTLTAGGRHWAVTRQDESIRQRIGGREIDQLDREIFNVIKEEALDAYSRIQDLGFFEYPEAVKLAYLFLVASDRNWSNHHAANSVSETLKNRKLIKEFILGYPQVEGLADFLDQLRQDTGVADQRSYSTKTLEASIPFLRAVVTDAKEDIRVQRLAWQALGNCPLSVDQLEDIYRSAYKQGDEEARINIVESLAHRGATHSVVETRFSKQPEALAILLEFYDQETKEKVKAELINQFKIIVLNIVPTPEEAAQSAIPEQDQKYNLFITKEIGERFIKELDEILVDQHSSWDVVRQSFDLITVLNHLRIPHPRKGEILVSILEASGFLPVDKKRDLGRVSHQAPQFLALDQARIAVSEFKGEDLIKIAEVLLGVGAPSPGETERVFYKNLLLKLVELQKSDKGLGRELSDPILRGLREQAEGADKKRLAPLSEDLYEDFHRVLHKFVDWCGPNGWLEPYLDWVARNQVWNFLSEETNQAESVFELLSTRIKGLKTEEAEARFPSMLFSEMYKAAKVSAAVKVDAKQTLMYLFREEQSKQVVKEIFSLFDHETELEDLLQVFGEISNLVQTVTSGRNYPVTEGAYPKELKQYILKEGEKRFESFLDQLVINTESDAAEDARLALGMLSFFNKLGGDYEKTPQVILQLLEKSGERLAEQQSSWWNSVFKSTLLEVVVAARKFNINEWSQMLNLVKKGPNPTDFVSFVVSAMPKLAQVIRATKNDKDLTKLTGLASLAKAIHHSVSERTVNYLSSEPVVRAVLATAEENLAPLCLPDGSLDIEKIDELLINSRELPSSRFFRFLDNHPERKEYYQRLQDESRANEWADVITDPSMFWENNIGPFLYLTQAGFSDFDFREFRRVINNPEVIEFLRDKSLGPDLAEIRQKLGLTMMSLSYLNLGTLLTAKRDLKDEFKMRFYGQLLAENPRSFKNAIYSISRNPEFDINNTEVQLRVKSAINRLGNISPITLRLYASENDPVKREEFVERVKSVRQKMFSNNPIKDAFSDVPEGADLLVEFITLSFPGTSLEDVRRELYQLEDRCSDLAGFNIREDGYEATPSTKVKIATLRKGEELNHGVLDDLRLMFPEKLDPGVKKAILAKFEQSARGILKSAGAFNFQQIKQQLPALLTILYEDEAVSDFRKTAFDFSQDENVSIFLSRATELLGVYFKDNFEQRLTEVLVDNDRLRQQMTAIMTRKKIDQISRDFSRIPEADLARLAGALRKIEQVTSAREQGSEQEATPQDLATVISVIVENRILSGKEGLRRMIKKELSKFEYKTLEGEETVAEIKFKGFVSKNAASYFAKETAGICTAGDLALFSWPNHFHINLVKDETVVGNIQGYIIDHQGKRALLFRGFNPSVSFVNRANAEVIADGMISIVKQFAQDNGIDDVFVSENLGSWHALTNRAGEGVYDYFQKRYLNSKYPGFEEVPVSIPITSEQAISKMYRVPME